MEYIQNLQGALEKLGVNAMIDNAKNAVLDFSETEVKARAATNLETWGPSGTQMGDLAQLTYR
eukprot:Ihof_evm1s1022 gene=Ihof_evmTU1s1022